MKKLATAFNSTLQKIPSVAGAFSAFDGLNQLSSSSKLWLSCLVLSLPALCSMWAVLCYCEWFSNFFKLCDWDFLVSLLLLVPSLSSSSAPAIPWKSWLYSGSGSCRVSEGGPGDCRHWNWARPRLRLPRALGLGRLRTDPLDDCLENWRENWRPRGRVGRFWTFSVVQRNALGPSWVGEQQTEEPILEIQRTESDHEGKLKEWENLKEKWEVYSQTSDLCKVWWFHYKQRWTNKELKIRSFDTLTQQKTNELPGGVKALCLLSGGRMQSILRFCCFVADVTRQRRADD